MNLKLGHLAAWLLLVAVALVTLAPIGWRPDSGLPVHLERFAAFAAIGLAFSLAYPRHLFLVALVVLGTAIAFEGLQFMVQTRHPGIIDVAAKLAGGMCGIIVGWLPSALRRPLPGADKAG